MNTPVVNKTPRQLVQQKYINARHNLLLVIILTAVNLVLLAAGSDSMLLFSATAPYMALAFGMISEIPVVLGIGISLAIIMLVAYALCWLLSKRHYGWMIAALVLFILDTLALIWLYITAEEISGILDVVFHAWILYYLVIGVINGKKLQTMPEDSEEPIAFEQPPAAEPMLNAEPLQAQETVNKTEE